ncbi:MAG: lasso peptide biosynthesis B2 protein [Anaerolineae bacterium]
MTVQDPACCRNREGVHCMNKRRAKFRNQVRLRLVSVATLIILNGIDLGLRMMGYRRLCKLLIRLSPKPDQARISVTRARKLGAVIHQVAGSSERLNCLRRSLALWWMLRWLHQPSAIYFGINPESGHAWLEHNGQVINDMPTIAAKYRIVLSDELIPETIAKMRM